MAGQRQSGQVIEKTVSDYTLSQWFPNTQQSRFLTACRRFEKLVLPSIFGERLSSLMMRIVQSYPTTVWMNECDIFGGSKRTLTLIHISGGFKPPTPNDLRPYVWQCISAEFIQQQFWMKVFGVKTYSDPSYIISGVLKTPNLQDLRPMKRGSPN